MYLTTGISDFSVGPFQMKPSFIEDMEKYVCDNPKLAKKYNNLISQGSNREKRKFRLEYLSSWFGQLKYLELFIMIAKSRTKTIDFKSVEDKLKYWATLYNAGINCSHEKVIRLQKIKSYPKFYNKFNYSEVSYEFFLKLHESGW